MAAADLASPLTLPAHLEAAEPPEARGLPRDGVRLLVSHVDTDTIYHSSFSELPRWLSAGDLLVVNTSGTLNAALPVRSAQGEAFELHLSTRLPGGFWTSELREPGPSASRPSLRGQAGMAFQLPAGAQGTLLAPYPLSDSLLSPSRLWLTALRLPGAFEAFLERYGHPIRYGYVRQTWPPAMYQTIFAHEFGSAEMPSAGRPFTAALVTTLVSRGIQIAPLVLHTGVASLEDHESPYEEFFRVPRHTAERVNAARRAGNRVVAVGTTVVRALESVTDVRGRAHPGEGWTNLVITAERPLRAVSGMITGLHEPRATHLAMVKQAIAAAGGNQSSSQLDRAYREALEAGYLWHEFGDAHLIVGGPLGPERVAR